MFVEDYHKEMEMTMNMARVYESPKATMTRFLSGLNKEITNVAEPHHCIDIKEMVYMAMKIERQLKNRGSSRGNYLSTP